MRVKARFRCSDVHEPSWNRSARQVALTAVYSADPNDPNHSWSAATPSGLVQMTITNPDAAEAFKVGGVYELTFEEVEA